MFLAIAVGTAGFTALNLYIDYRIVSFLEKEAEDE